jgi:hypothetical protein
MNTERASRIESVRIMVTYNWMFLRHLYLSVQDRLGDAGLATLETGIRRHGYYRGESLRSSPRGCSSPRGAFAVLRAWDTAELAMASAGEQLDVTGDAAEAIVELQRVPGSEYFASNDGGEVLALYWREMLAGLVAGYDAALSISYNPVEACGAGEWTMRFAFAGAQSDADVQPPADAFTDAVQAIEMSRRTAGVFSGLCMHTTQALVERFGGTGEEVARQALYAFGAERAVGMREEAQRRGMPLDFKSWYDIMAKRDPDSAAWVFRDNTHVSPGVFQVTCTYCPMADVWAEEGTAGLSLGYIYDMEVHRGLVEAFNPEGIVAWEQVKTRGDRVCNFRFSIPSLVTEDDPPWARGLTNK